MNLSLIRVVALTLTAFPAHASDWRPVIADAGTLIHLVDAETLPATRQSQPTVRTLMVFAKGIRTDFQAMIMTSQFDCVVNRVRMVRAVAFDEQGASISDEASLDSVWKPIEPDTGLAGLAEVICGKRPVSTRRIDGEVPIAAARVLIGTAPAED